MRLIILSVYGIVHTDTDTDTDTDTLCSVDDDGVLFVIRFFGTAQLAPNAGPPQYAFCRKAQGHPLPNVLLCEHGRHQVQPVQNLGVQLSGVLDW